MNCPVCNTEVPPSAGRGRPQVYCTESCRRAAEFTIRRIARRLDANEIELRAALEGFTLYGHQYPYQDECQRLARVRVLRKWVKQDDARLRALLGGPAKESNEAAKPSKSGANPTQSVTNPAPLPVINEGEVQ